MTARGGAAAETPSADAGDAPQGFHAGLEAWLAGEPDRARRELQRAVDADPDDAPARYLLAVVLRASGDRMAARQMLEPLVDPPVGSAAEDHRPSPGLGRAARYLMEILLRDGEVG